MSIYQVRLTVQLASPLALSALVLSLAYLRVACVCVLIEPSYVQLLSIRVLYQFIRRASPSHGSPTLYMHAFFSFV